MLRSWLRIHLLTGLVLMLAAGALLGVNLVGREPRGKEFEAIGRDYRVTGQLYGWPAVYSGAVKAEPLPFSVLVR